MSKLKAINDNLIELSATYSAILSNIMHNNRQPVEKQRGLVGIEIPNYIHDARAEIDSYASHATAMRQLGGRERQLNKDVKNALSKIDNWLNVATFTDTAGREWKLSQAAQTKQVVQKLKDINKEFANEYFNLKEEINEMQSFKEFLSEGFTHSTHLEDLVLDMGVEGTRSAVNALRDFRDTFAGNDNKKDLNLSVKWDGAPAVIFGTDPATKKFFVGTKGIFAKTPKINYTPADIDMNHSGELAVKLKQALTYLPAITPKNKIFQGDFMFSSHDLGTQVINGEKNVTMHPNTIVYTAPVNSKTGQEILKAKMGIVVHTEYTGKSIQELIPTFGITVDNFKKSSNVWLSGAKYNSAAGIANFTASETAAFDKILSDIGALFKSVGSKTFKLLSTDADVNSLVNIFNNSKVRSGGGIDPSTQAKELFTWIFDRYQKDIDSKSTTASKEKLEAKRAEVMSKLDKNELTNIFKLQAKIVEAKMIVINKLNEIKNLSTFVKTGAGEFKVTNHEGFVGIEGDIAGVKLVDRLEFSHNNFSKNIIKGWSK